MATATFVARFNPGAIVLTRGAAAQLKPSDILTALARHLVGDWGELDDEDRQSNDLAVLEGSRLLSAYTGAGGVRFWVITEADRSVTTFLLPEEY